MTYEEYLASPEEMRRYDIIDGYKVYRLYGVKQLPNPTVEHQEIQGNLYVPFRNFARSTGLGRALQPPCDVLIRRNPTRSRQPDLLFISNKRFGDRSRADAAPLSPAPELVVEILSPSDTRRVQQAKLTDYASVGVDECWLVSPEAQSVEVLRREGTGFVPVAIYGQGQTVTAVTFADLTVSVDDIFAE